MQLVPQVVSASALELVLASVLASARKSRSPLSSRLRKPQWP